MRKVLEKIILHESIKKTSVFLRENKKIVLVLLAVYIFVDIFFVKASYDLVIFGILLLYAIFVKILQIKSKLTFLFCLGLLTIMSVNYFLSSASVSTEKAAVWLILFLVIGVIQQWKE